MASDESAGVRLAIFTGERVGIHDLPPGRRLVIGRGDECDVRVDAAGVSRQHAVVYGGPPLEVEDLGGPNGTIVSSVGGEASAERTDRMKQLRLTGERAQINVGASISIGSALVVVRRASEPTGSHAHGVIVADRKMREVYEEAGRAARSSLAVLILGETGVGKDVLAQWIHDASPRKKRPFLALNCAALSESLLESELFGYERGAFTGAQQRRPGLLESADGGTIFLDEIGDLPPTLQAKLLRVIERREVLRLGARTPRAIDVRFVSATNKDLERAMERGEFRQDLYFRLNGIALTVPPLRERSAEVALLARRFLARAVADQGHSGAPDLTADAVAVLERYSWPGNVRELRNVIERAALLASGAPLALTHLPKHVVEAKQRADTLKGAVAESERRRIVEALVQCDGNQTRAAEVLGVSRRTLINRLEEYGIERPRKK